MADIKKDLHSIGKKVERNRFVRLPMSSMVLVASMAQFFSSPVYADDAVEELFPAGSGRAEVMAICSSCHSLAMIAYQGRSPQDWDETISRMSGLGVSFSGDDRALIHQYLAQNFPQSSRLDGSSSEPVSLAIGGPRRFERPSGPDRWPVHGGGHHQQNFSELTQIDKSNVHELEVAWVYNYGTGEHDLGDVGMDYRFEVTPLVIGGLMYITTPGSPNAPHVSASVTALKPESGEVVWRFESPYNIHGRGLAYWPGDATTSPRLIFGTQNGYIMALDVTTGTLAPEFGLNGVIDAYIGAASEVVGESRRSTYSIPNPVTIYNDLIIAGSRPGEALPPGPRGSIRAFSAKTGRLAWTFYTVPAEGEPNSELVPQPELNIDISGANPWSVMTLDLELGIVYAPLGDLNARRPGTELFSSSLVALDASSGELLWYRQITNRDMWDWDSPTPAVLLDFQRDGESIPAVLLTGKHGLVFLFDRRTGEPLNGFEQRTTPRTDIEGIEPWPTQPFPFAPEPIARTGMTREEIPNVAPGMKEHCEALWDQVDPISEGLYALPRNDRATVSGPGTTGGPNWGGGSYNAELGYYFINVQNRLRFTIPGDNLSHFITRDTVLPGRDSPRGQGQGGGFSFSYRYAGMNLPCSPAPWGELVAVDINNLEIAWRSPLGMIPELADADEPSGAFNLGGNISTASGLVFIGASNDRRLWAYDARSGDILWEAELPASAHSTPITYMGDDGKQYVVVAAGGGTSVSRGFSLSTRMSDSVVAFALPSSED